MYFSGISWITLHRNTANLKTNLMLKLLPCIKKLIHFNSFTLRDVERQLQNGSFRKLYETEMYSNVTEMDATIERDTSQNTNYVGCHRKTTS